MNFMAHRSSWLSWALVLFATAASAEVTPLSEPIEPSAGQAFGDWPDELAIEMPRSPRGFAPRVAIVHSKSSRGGVLGDGYALSAGGSVVRRSATGGVPGHTVDDLYRLDGERLVPASTLVLPRASGLRASGRPPVPDGVLKVLYELERDGEGSISWSPDTNTWERRREGWTWTYGSAEETGRNATKRLREAERISIDPRLPRLRSNASLIEGGTFETAAGPCSSAEENPLPRCNTAEWLLSRVEDPYGNRMLYHYRVEAVPAKLDGRYRQESARRHLLDRIEWFAADGARLGEVRFRYGAQPSPGLSFASGTLTLSGSRLTSIEVASGGGALFALYELEYKDQGGPDCDGNALALDTQGERDLVGDHPLQSLLRRVVQVDPQQRTRRRTLRCIETHHQALDLATWGAETPLYFSIPKPAFNLNPGTTRVLPLPVEINGDGKSDLLLLAMSGAAKSHRVLIGRGRDFQEPLDERPEEPGVAAWQRLADESIGSEDAWLIADIDADGFTDFLHDGDGDEVILARYVPGYQTFGTAPLALDVCDLRYSTTADIDGDGRVDLVRRAHPPGEGCEEKTFTRWLRNRGESPWFDPADWQRLDVPLEDPEAAGISMALPSFNPDWTPATFVAEQASWSDVNGDGIADLAYAFHARWEQHFDSQPCPNPPPRFDDEPCQWRPVPGSAYSRLFWGDGYGGFVDSGLAVGEPTYDVQPGWPGWYYTTYRSFTDLDASGAVELLAARRDGAQPPKVRVSSWRGPAYGFAETLTESAPSPAAPSERFALPLAAYPEPGSDCYDDTSVHEKLSTFALADFDGDGFSDLLSIVWDPQATGATCTTAGWCTSIRWSGRSTVEGRVTSSDGSWGGRTRLEWEFTGKSLLNANPELRRSVEVLAAVEGSAGRVELEAGLGIDGPDGFAGFGLVRRRNARGGVEYFVQGISPPLAGKELVAARYRVDGSLETATVRVHGQLARGGSGYEIDLSAPFLNPLLRECVFEAERGEAPALEKLFEECWSWGGRKAPSRAELWAAYGLDRYTLDLPARTTGSLVWNRRNEPSDPSSVVLAAADADEAPYLWPLLPSPGLIPIGWRWDRPLPDAALVARLDPNRRPEDWLPVEPGLEEVLGHTVKAARGKGWTLYVTDHHYEDPSLPRATRVERHRDVSTPADDLISKLDWESAENGYRQTAETVKDRAGQVFHRRTLSDFAGFDDPGTLTVCGSGGNGCVTTRTKRHANGELSERSQDGIGVLESVELAPWCGLHTTTDAAGRKRVERFDEHCRRIEETWRGVATRFTYDGLHRVAGETVEPNANAEAVTTTYSYDDALSRREDSTYAEPRWARTEGRRLQLTYLDGFGRTTREVSCEAGEVSVAADGNLTARCRPGTEIVRSWTAYGTDGLPRAEAAPFAPAGELPVFTVVPYRDGAGRTLLRLRPAPVALAEEAPRWTSDYGWSAPGRWVAEDALGRVTVETTGSLAHTIQVEGKTLAHEDFDAFGRTVRIETPEEGALRLSYDARHRVQAIEREQPAEVLDRDGALAPESWRREFRWDALDRVIREVEPDGTEIVREVDRLGRPLSRDEISPGGTRRKVGTWSYRTLPDGGEETLFTDELGATETTVVDGLNRIVRTEDAAGVVRERFDEPAQSRRRTVVHDGGLVLATTEELDVHGRVVAIAAPDGRTLFDLDGAGRVTRTTSPEGAVATRGYLFSGALDEERLLGGGGSWLLRRDRYDDAGRTTSSRTRGIERRLRYDSLDRIQRVEAGAGDAQRIESLDYEGDGPRVRSRRTEAPGVDSHEVASRYDAWGREVERDGTGPGSVAFAYDLAGRLRRTIDEEGAVLERRYDGRGRLASLDLPGAGALDVTYRYDVSYTPRLADGAAIPHLAEMTATDADGAEVTSWHDALGRPIAVSNPDGSLEERRYAGSRLADVYRGSPLRPAVRSRVHFEYDATGRLVGRYGPDRPEAFPEPFAAESFSGVSVALTRGAGGRLEALDAAGERTTFTYSAQSGLPEAEGYRGLVTAYDYPSARGDHYPWQIGLRTTGRGGAQRRTSYRRDELGRIAEATTRAGGQVVVGQWRDFDSWGRPTVERRLRGATLGAATVETELRWRFDAGRPRERELLIGGVSQGSTSWTWYANGALKSEKGPSGPALDYVYGTPFDFRLDRVVSRADGAVLGQVSARSAAGRPLAITLPDGSIELEWDGLGRLVRRRSLDPEGGELAAWSGRYDPLGRLADESSTGTGSEWKRRFEYDPAGRLVAEVADQTLPRAGGWRFDYDLNAAGGRVSTALDGAVVTRVDYDPDFPVERVTAVDGVRLRLDPWDGVLVDQHGIAYRRGPDGQVDGVARGNLSYTLYRDAQGLPFAVDDRQGRRRLTSWRLDPAAPPIAVRGFDGIERTFPSIEGVALTALGAGPSPTTAGLLVDVTGLLRRLLEGDLPGRTAFGAWPSGTGRAASRLEGSGFAGMEVLPGLEEVLFARHRVYDPATGRFLRPDPVGLAGGLHRTLYADGDPVQQADPLGLWACPARPGHLPRIGGALVTPQVPPPAMSASGNLHYDIQQMELAAGLEPVESLDWSQVDFFATTNPYSPPPCAFHCEPPGDGGEGLPGDGVNPWNPFAGGSGTAFFGSGQRRAERKAERAERRLARKQERWERQYERRILRLIERGQLSLDDLDAEGTGVLKDLSELEELAVSLADCRTGSCIGRRQDKIDHFVSLLIGDPREPTPRAKAPDLPSESFEDANRRQDEALDAIRRSRENKFIEVAIPEPGDPTSDRVIEIGPLDDWSEPPLVDVSPSGRNVAPAPRPASKCPPENMACRQRELLENPPPAGVVPGQEELVRITRPTLEEKIQMERERRLREWLEQQLREFTKKIKLLPPPLDKLPIYLKPQTRELCVGKGPIEYCWELPDESQWTEDQLRKAWEEIQRQLAP